MPQLPTSTAEEYGAEDEIKQYTQEEDEGSDDVDVVNDIKDDLLNEDDNAKGDEQLFQPTSSRYGKGDNHGLSYGRPAPVIVGPHHGYYEQSNGYSRTNSSQAPSNYSSSTQIRMPVYPRDERAYSYEHGPWPPQVPVPHYSMPYGPGMKNYSNYRYPPGIHPGVAYYPPGHGYPGMPGRPVKEPKRPHVKKPLNAFMLFMKEQRPKIAAEFTLKESAAINQILGKRWHALDKSEQAKYYDMARKERAIHMQMYPGWSARDNYAQLGRKKKRPRDKNEEMNPKKCRARYGLDRQEQWCKPCRRKKKCIRFIVGADGETTEVMDKDHVDVNSDSDNDNNGEGRTVNINNNNNSITEVVSSAKENINERISKENIDTIVTNNNNINMLADSSKIVHTSASSTGHFIIKTELNRPDQVTSAPDSLSHESSLLNRTLYSSMNNCTTSPSRTDKQSIDTSVLKTISAPCS